MKQEAKRCLNNERFTHTVSQEVCWCSKCGLIIWQRAWSLETHDLGLSSGHIELTWVFHDGCGREGSRGCGSVWALACLLRASDVTKASGNGKIGSCLCSGDCCLEFPHDGSDRVAHVVYVTFIIITSKQYNETLVCLIVWIYSKYAKHGSAVSVSPLRGCRAAAQTLADYAGRGRGSDPGGHGSLWGPGCGCGHGPRSGCCHSLSGARSVARAGGRALACGWRRRGSPWKALRVDRQQPLM